MLTFIGKIPTANFRFSCPERMVSLFGQRFR